MCSPPQPAGSTHSRRCLRRAGHTPLVSPFPAAYKNFLLFSIRFLLPSAILPAPDKQAVSTAAGIQAGAGAAGRIRTLRLKAPLASPLQSPLLSPANSRCLQAAIRQDQTRWLCGEPAHSQSSENGHKPSWEQNQRPRHPSRLSPQLRVFIVFAPIFFSWSKDSGFPLYSMKPPQQQGWPGTPLLLPCICGGVKL